MRIKSPSSTARACPDLASPTAVNVRVANPAARRSSGPATPYLGTSQPLPATAATSPERVSLLVPEISKRFRGVLTDLYNSLPPQPKMDWLVTHYLSSLSWYWVAHHAPTFLAEYDAFRHLVAEGRQLEIDPLWLAVLFLVSCPRSMRWAWSWTLDPALRCMFTVNH